MTNSEQNSLVVEPTTEAIEHKFQQLNLQEIGLQQDDFNAVLAARKELAEINHNAVAEYGKNIATQTSGYTKNNIDMHFNTTKEQIDTLVKEIEKSQSGLKARVDTLDRMFHGVQSEYKQLGVYIAAGKLKQDEIQQEISTLTAQAQDQTTTQRVYDLNHLANNLEKRVSDLQVLQQSAMQTLPMIRIIQSNNLMLVDKFYAIKNITLPAWKNQISLAISLNEQKNSVQLANTIDDATNDLLKRNADLLHQNSVDTAKANQRSVIDIETLEHVQNTLIKTVNDVIQIQKEGMQKRAEATTRLRSLQDNLNQLVLDSSSNRTTPS